MTRKGRSRDAASTIGRAATHSLPDAPALRTGASVRIFLRRKRREARLLARLQRLHAGRVGDRIADRELVAHLLQLTVFVEVEEEHFLDGVNRPAVLVLDGADDLVRLDVDD